MEARAGEPRRERPESAFGVRGMQEDKPCFLCTPLSEALGFVHFSQGSRDPALHHGQIDIQQQVSEPP